MKTRHLSLAFSVLALLAAEATASAAPTVRRTLDVRGDVVAIGSTLGWDCGSGLTPPAGATVGCTGVGAAEADSAPDMYWRDNTAATTTLSTEARTSANLAIPTGATVVYARLYWSAMLAGLTGSPPDPDLTAVLDRPDKTGVPTLNVTADSSNKLATDTGPASPTVPYIVYQSSADVTTFVQTHGAGIYRVTGVSGIVLHGVVTETAYSAWTLVVAYSLPTDKYRHIQILDGLDLLNGSTAVNFTMSGYRIPTASAAGGKIMVWAYDGDDAVTGDGLTFKGTTLSNTLNPASNPFNSSRTFLGVAQVGAVPALSGVPKSMAGYDLDAFDISSLLAGGDTSGAFSAIGTTGETYWLGGIVSTIESSAPNLNATKTFVDLNGGSVKPGDILEFTIDVKNDGEDEAIDVVLTDPLPAGLTYVPGSLSVATGANAGAKTDATGDDQGEFTAGTVRVRLGTGANATAGGSLAVGASTSVKFRVTVTGAPGTAVNQGTIRAGGKLGAPPADYLTDGDPVTPGKQGTNIIIKECDSSGGCTPPKVCNTTTGTCVDPDAGVDGGGDTGFDTAVTDGAGDTGGDDTGGGDTGGDDTGAADTGGDAGDDTGAGDTGGDTGGAGDGSVVDDGGDAGDGGTSSLDEYVAEGGGCGCSLPGGRDVGAGLLAAGALAGLAFARRKNRDD